MMEQVKRAMSSSDTVKSDLERRKMETADPAEKKTTLLIRNVTIQVSVRVVMERPLTRSRSRSYDVRDQTIEPGK